jgi:hypothetical protein
MKNKTGVKNENFKKQSNSNPNSGFGASFALK